jgi:site-specific recombinase XerD
MTHGELVADVVALSPITRHPRGLAAAADAFLDHADVAATTRRVYRMSLAALVDGLGPARAMADVTGELVADWFRSRYATVAPATWNRELATLRSAVAWWRAHGWLATDPTTSLARRREHPDRTRALIWNGLSRRRFAWWMAWFGAADSSRWSA